uniref:Uncharacterized protein n=1 Tax=Strongyloides venezuelensis TaxID=75913 RepID=A0A0K0FEP1_STRVS
MSEFHNYRTIFICHQRNSSLTNYSDVLTFTVNKIYSLELSILPGIETDEKLQALIGIMLYYRINTIKNVIIGIKEAMQHAEHVLDHQFFMILFICEMK